MDTAAVIRELIAQTERPLALAEADLRAAQDRLEKLRAERFGLELALARHLGEPSPSRPSVATGPSRTEPDSSGWQALGRTDAALRGLEEAGKPIHRKALHALLHSHGRDDSLENLSAALAYLNRNGRAVSKGYGMWVHPNHDQQELDHDQSQEDLEPEPEDAEDPAEAGPSSVSLVASERRTEDADHHPHGHPAPVTGA